MASVVAFLIGCAVVLVAGASGSQAQASQQNKQERTKASKKERRSSPRATASGEARCEGTRRINANRPVRYTTNDLPGCPKGGPLLGTDKADELAGEKGDDEVRALGGTDDLMGGSGDDVIYGGDGDDYVSPDEGNDAIYGGDGNDVLAAHDARRDRLYCGAGRDQYLADPNDYVDSSCETASASAQPPDDFGDDVAPVQAFASSASASPVPVPPSGGPDILLPAAALLLGSGIVTYAILGRR